MDEPESALSPKRQIDLLKVLQRIQKEGNAQVIMATHSPILMALPGAELLQISHLGLEVIDFRETSHFRLYRDFVNAPDQFLEQVLKSEDDQ